MRFRRRSCATYPTSFTFNRLEPRQLLAGDVSVFVDGDSLYVIGDSSPNIVNVIGSGDTVRVEGIDTTINGGTNRFETTANLRHAFVQLNEGDDIASIRNLNVRKQITFQGNAGDDQLRLLQSTAKSVETSLGVGNDVLEFRGVQTSQDIRVTMGAGNDLVAVENTVAGRNFKVWGHAGDDLFAADDLYSKRKYQIDLGTGDDQCVLAGLVDVWKTAKVYLGNGDDFFAAVPNETNDAINFRKRLMLDAGAGNDQVAFDSGVTLHKRSVILGGSGNDAFEDGNAAFAQRVKLRSFEATSVPQIQNTLDAVFARLLANDLDPFDQAVPVELQIDAETQFVTVNDSSPTVSTQWDQAIQQAVVNTSPGPTVASRAYAMVHTAMFDAWSAYDVTASSTVLADDLQQPAHLISESNKREAMSYAAYRVATDLFETETPLFDELMNQLGYDSQNRTTNTTTPAGVGNVMAAELLRVRHQDGSNQLGDDPNGTGEPYSDTTDYEPVNDVGNPQLIEAWTPEFVPIDAEPGSEERTQEFLTPQWGTVEPFALASGDELRPEAPEPFLLVEGDVDLEAKTITLADESVVAIEPEIVGTIINPAFVEQAERVVQLSAELTDEQKLIAEFWEDGGGTSFPPGTWMTFGQYTSARDNHTIDDDAKLFFALGNAVFDAGVSTWEAKVAYDYVRPVRAIRELGELGLIGEFNEALGGHAIEAWTPDGGTQTILATEFLTYQTPGSDPSPPFAEYTSGHSAFSAAGAEVLKLFTGSDTFGAAVTFEPGSSRFEPGSTPTSTVTLAWETYTAAADEAGLSRLFGGIHFDDGDLNGRTLGTQVGAAVWEQANRFINGESV
ncbi:MAG: DUF6851 domain-containing protein [Planctomycetota bacterium]